MDLLNIFVQKKTTKEKQKRKEIKQTDENPQMFVIIELM
jgi:hypothetical protein